MLVKESEVPSANEMCTCTLLAVLTLAGVEIRKILREVSLNSAFST